MRIADRVSSRFGIHHFSGHYGDEMLEKFYGYNEVNFAKTYKSGSLFNYAKTHTDADTTKEYYLNGSVEYVRDNSWILAVSADLPYGFRIYGEAELPKNPSWLRPFIHVPADYDNPVPGDDSHPTLIDRIGALVDIIRITHGNLKLPLKSFLCDSWNGRKLIIAIYSLGRNSQKICFQCPLCTMNHQKL